MIFEGVMEELYGKEPGKSAVSLTKNPGVPGKGQTSVQDYSVAIEAYQTANDVGSFGFSLASNNLVRDGQWKDKNGIWRDLNKRPNGITGPKNATLGKAGALGAMSKVCSAVSAVCSGYEGSVTIDESINEDKLIYFALLKFYPTGQIRQP